MKNESMELSSAFELTFTLQLFSSYFLTGLIWTIQMVHYPAFRFVNENNFSSFAQIHSKQITKVVMPLMITELITAFLLILAKGLDQVGFTFFVTNFVLVICIWASTFFLSVPCHNKLMKKRTEEVIERLISTNWPRTIFWTLKSLALLYWTIYT